MLDIDQLNVSADPWGERPLLAGLSLMVAPGEAVAATGPSGCGKTTLLRAIAGLIDPTGGGVTFGGCSPHDMGWPTFRRRVCLVPQRPVLAEGSVQANLVRPFRFGSVARRYDDKLARMMLGRVGLEDVMAESGSTLSQGQRQRVCLVRALLIEPRVLLLDEPTSALDDQAVRRVESLLIDQMVDRGLGVLIATHDRAQAQRFCSRVIDLSPFLVAREAVAGA